MAVPRPVLLALLGLALCAAAFLATRGARDPGGEVTSLPTPVSTPAQQAKQSSPSSTPAKHKAAPAHKAQKAHKPAAAATPKAQSTTAQPKAAPKAAARPQLSTAQRVKQSLAKGDVVVFFFTHAGAADDTATRGAVQALHGAKHVMVVDAGLADLTKFRTVLAGAGVTQIPSVVAVHDGKKARLFEGYIDRATLRQNVADLLR
jgi:hypothetical protein